MPKILILNPFAGVTREAEHCQEVAASDTELLFDNISKIYPLTYVTYIYYRHHCASAVVERVLQAQEEGFDAVFICCCYDPGLAEAREIADIIVTGAFESSVHYINQIAQRYSVIATEPKTVHCYRELAQLYGTDSKLASVRHINLSARESYNDKTDPVLLVKRIIEVAQRCIEDDGAEAIIMGCTLQSCPLTVAKQGYLQGVPIIDPVLIGFKHTEFLIEAKRVGLPVISRYGTWQKPPVNEVVQLRSRYFTE